MHHTVVLVALLLVLVHTMEVPSQRNIQVQLNEQQLQIQATSQNITIQDAYQFNVNLGENTEDILRVFFQYQREKNQTQIQFTLDIKSLFEIDLSSTSYYQGDTKTIISSWPQNGTSVAWKNWVDESKEVNGIHIYSYSATTRDGLFTVRVLVTPTGTDWNNVALDPNNVKMDFEIHNYKYSRNNTRLVMQSHISSQTQSENTGENAANNGLLAFGKPGTPMGVFSWEGLVNTTTETVPVTAWSPSAAVGTQFDLFFTFITAAPVQPMDLVWDPRVGVDYGSIEFCMGKLCGGNAFVTIAASVVGAVILVSLITVIMLRRRNRDNSYQEIE